MVGKESGGVLKRDPCHWNVWGLDPWDVAKNYAAFAEGASCVDVKRQGGGGRGVEGAAVLLSVREEQVW